MFCFIDNLFNKRLYKNNSVGLLFDISSRSHLNKVASYNSHKISI